MQRRSELAAAGRAGCLTSALGEGGNETGLDPQAGHQYDGGGRTYPKFRDPLSTFTAPDPLTGDPAASDDMDGPLVVTACFAACPAECVNRIGRLAWRIEGGA